MVYGLVIIQWGADGKVFVQTVVVIDPSATQAMNFYEAVVLTLLNYR